MSSTPADLQNHVDIGSCQLLRDICDQPGVDSVEGRLVPLLSGEEFRTQLIEMQPGMYCEPHPHSSESLIYTVKGSWVFCTLGSDSEVEERVVIDAGDLFYFPPNTPTGFEVPFDEPASMLIIKGGSLDRETAFSMLQTASKSMDAEAEAGAPFTYSELDSTHAAVAYRAKVRNEASE